MPPRSRTSAEIDECPAPFYERTGATTGLLEPLISQRRQWPGVSFMEAAAMAGEKALASSGIDRSRIGLVVDSSVCRERPSRRRITVHNLLRLLVDRMNFDISNAAWAFTRPDRGTG